MLNGMRIALSVALIALAGCSFDTSGIGGKVACERSSDCVTGTCVDGTCTRQAEADGSETAVGDTAQNGADLDGAGLDGADLDGAATDGLATDDAPGDGGAVDDGHPDGDDPACAPNACGGCAALPNRPGDPCGRCSNGRWACDGGDAVVCAGASEDVCGACDGPFGVATGDPCGCGANTPGDTAGWTCATGVADCDDGNSEAFGGPMFAETEDDTAGPFTRRGALQFVGDEDWAVLRVVDGGGFVDTSSAQPTVTMTGAEPGDYVCLFWFYDDARDYTLDCGAGTYGTEERTGALGCCSLGTGATLQAELRDGASFTGGLDSGGDASGDLWIVVGSRAMASSCHDYSLRVVL